MTEGFMEGSTVGVTVGLILGSTVGLILGSTVGFKEGITDGSTVGVNDGASVWPTEKSTRHINSTISTKLASNSSKDNHLPIIIKDMCRIFDNKEPCPQSLRNYCAPISIASNSMTVTFQKHVKGYSLGYIHLVNTPSPPLSLLLFLQLLFPCYCWSH